MFMRMLSANKQNLFDLMKSQAQFHGSYSEPEMEVGDLQEMLAATLTLVPESDLPELVRSLDDTADLNEAIEEAKEEDPEEWEFLDSPPPAKLPVDDIRGALELASRDLGWTEGPNEQVRFLEEMVLSLLKEIPAEQSGNVLKNILGKHELMQRELKEKGLL